MRRLWQRILNVGVTPDIPDREAKYIRLTNGFAVVNGIMLLSFIPSYVLYLPSSKYVILNLTIFPVLWLLCLYLNSRRAYLASKLYLAYTCLVSVSLNSLQMGRDTDNHWILLLLIPGAFHIFPPRHLKYIILISASAVVSILGLELYLADRPPIIEAPAEFFTASRVLSLSFLCVLLFVITLLNYRALNAAQDLAEHEHQKSEQLLLNILPESIAKRLKEHRSIIADRTEAATVLFADVVGFTAMSQTMTAEQVVRLLNDLFVEFDHLSKKYGLEKIKTIGDAYMVVGGLPKPLVNHCGKVAAFALELQDMLKRRHDSEAGNLQVRIGIHTGPMVAGVIGESKFLYDLWGDTVNTASRMESHSEPGKIQVTREVRELLRDRFAFSTGREIEVKGKGLMEVYFLTGQLGTDTAKTVVGGPEGVAAAGDPER
jgi:class 3 adenylate cyclase